MPAREDPIDAAARRVRAEVAEAARGLRAARVERGLSQSDIARAAHVSGSLVSRIEHGEVPGVPAPTLARLLAAVGLELAVRVYPAGEPIRDRAHLALLGRFRAAIGSRWRWRVEVPVAPHLDRSAWDAVMASNGVQVGVEAETRLRDVQAVQRRVSLKQRDSAFECAVLVLADTRNNRGVVREYADILAAAFPTATAAALADLRAGNAPRSNALVLI